MLTEHEKIRYARQILLDGWGEKGQKRLKDLTVFVAGAGGTGSPTITQLALLGVGCIKVCDFDTFDVPNMNRQFIHLVSDESRIGVNKAYSAQQTVHNINPNVRVEVFDQKFTDDNIDDMVGDAEIIFDCVDKFEPKFVLSKCAIRKKIPQLFSGIIDINSFICIFYPPKTPCFHCIYDFNKLKQVNELEVIRPGKGMSIPVSVPNLFSSTGFMMMEALKMVLDLGEPAYNQYTLFLQKCSNKIAKTAGYEGLKFWNTEFFNRISKEQGFDWDNPWRGNEFEVIELKPNPECPYCSGLHHQNKKSLNLMEDFNF